jgi:uncharacterized membrane protein YuzA (DUF378 family)
MVNSSLDRLSLALIIIGAINWLLVGLFNFDVVATLFGGQTAIVSKIVYSIIGIAGIYSASLLFRHPSRAEEQ